VLKIILEDTFNFQIIQSSMSKMKNFMFIRVQKKYMEVREELTHGKLLKRPISFGTTYGF